MESFAESQLQYFKGKRKLSLVPWFLEFISTILSWCLKHETYKFFLCINFPLPLPIGFFPSLDRVSDGLFMQNWLKTILYVVKICTAWCKVQFQHGCHFSGFFLKITYNTIEILSFMLVRMPMYIFEISIYL